MLIRSWSLSNRREAPVGLERILCRPCEFASFFPFVWCGVPNKASRLARNVGPQRPRDAVEWSSVISSVILTRPVNRSNRSPFKKRQLTTFSAVYFSTPLPRDRIQIESSDDGNGFSEIGLMNRKNRTQRSEALQKLVIERYCLSSSLSSSSTYALGSTSFREHHGGMLTPNSRWSSQTLTTQRSIPGKCQRVPVNSASYPYPVANVQWFHCHVRDLEDLTSVQWHNFIDLTVAFPHHYLPKALS